MNEVAAMIKLERILATVDLLEAETNES